MNKTKTNLIDNSIKGLITANAIQRVCPNHDC